jgi:pseudouridine synthase
VKEPLRLNRYLAMSGVASRRRCDELIREGRVAVNGTRVEELGSRVVPDDDEVTVDGVAVRLPAAHHTLALNKPPGVLVAASDGRGRRTVMDLLGDFRGRVFPVGRLDLRSEGLLLFTSDGELAYRLAHPRFKVTKLYRVQIAGRISPAVLEAMRRGVELEDGRTQPAGIRLLEKGRGRATLEIELREGRKRQIRRMLAVFGHEVVMLRRVRFGPIELGDLVPGAWRELGAADVAALRSAVGLAGGTEGGGDR